MLMDASQQMMVSGIIKPAKIASTTMPASRGDNNNEFQYMKKVQICGSISELNCTSFNHKATTAFSLCQFVVMAQIKLKWKVKN